MTSSPPFRLAVDVGNSRIKFGLFLEADRDVAKRELPQCLNSTTVSHGDSIPWSEIQAWADDSIEAEFRGVVAGGHPDEISRVCDTWPTNLGPKPLVVENTGALPLSAHVDEPDRVGIDRLLNGIAANVIRPENFPAIVVDCGTATTVDFISAAGVFQGGAILPGFDLLARSLHEYTALLPMVPINELASEPNDPIGKNTRSAIRSGQIWGQLGSIKELIRRMSSPAGSESRASRATSGVLVVLTGGGAPLLVSHLDGARFEPHLALQGLTLAAPYSEQESHQ